MYDPHDPDAPKRLHIYILPEFNIAATMNFLDPFRAANYLEGRQLYSWSYYSEGGGYISASNGAMLQTKTVLEATRELPHMAFVSASWKPLSHNIQKIGGQLRRLATKQIPIGALDTGAFVLARLGLLNDHRATVHYEQIDAFQELFPDIDLCEALFVFDRNRICCAGGVAAAECALHILSEAFGSDLANRAARYIFAHPLRATDARQNPQDKEPLGQSVPSIIREAIHLMERNLETVTAIPMICRELGLSHRHFNRIFRAHVGKTPSQYYRDVRLDRARGLVTQTDLTFSEIAAASGFSSQVYFSRSYRERFGLSPSLDRVEGRIPFEFRAWPMHRRKP